MSHITTLTRRAGTSSALAVVVHMLCAGVAFGHAGDSHEQGRVSIDPFVEVAGAVAAMVVLYVLATWFFRYRDNRDSGSTSGYPPPDRVSRLHGPDPPDSASPPPSTHVR